MTPLNGTGELDDPQLPWYYAPYLGHNDPLRPYILAEVASAKIGPLKELDGVERNVQVLETVLAALRSRSKALKSLLSAYDTILAPIRGLPDDVLEEIFCHCLPTARNARPFVSESPLLLTLVCKKWRRVALAAPRLWATLHIPINFDYNPTKPRVQYQMPTSSVQCYFDQSVSVLSQSRVSELQTARNVGLDGWLGRSGALPLSISIHDVSATSEKDRYYTEMTLDLIARRADRISVLEAMAPLYMDELVRAISRYFDFATLPQLRRLQILDNGVPGGVSVGQHSNSLSVFLSAKLLQKLSVIVLLDSLQDFTQIFHSLSGSSTIQDLSLYASADRLCPQRARNRGTGRPILAYNRRIGPPPSQPLSTHQAASNTPRSQASVQPAHSTIRLPALKALSICGPLVAIERLCNLLEAMSVLTLKLDMSWNPHPIIHVPSLQHLMSLPRPSMGHLHHFVAQCTSLHTLILNTSGTIKSGELLPIFNSLPHIATLVLRDGGIHVDPVNDISTPQDLPSPAATAPIKYSLNILMEQQQASTITGNGIHHFKEQLLPNLTSFTWSQLPLPQMPQTPNDLLVRFITDRLYPGNSPSFIGLSVTPLKDIKIRLLLTLDAIDVEARIARHAESMGMRRDIDFNLDVSAYPPETYRELYTTQVLRYVIPKGYSYKTPVIITDDNLDIQTDMTWPPSIEI